MHHRLRTTSEHTGVARKSVHPRLHRSITRHSSVNDKHAGAVACLQSSSQPTYSQFCAPPANLGRRQGNPQTGDISPPELVVLIGATDPVGRGSGRGELSHACRDAPMQ